MLKEIQSKFNSREWNLDVFEAFFFYCQNDTKQQYDVFHSFGLNYTLQLLHSSVSSLVKMYALWKNSLILFKIENIKH